MANKSRKRSDRGLYALLALGLGVVAVLFAYVKGTPADRIPGDLLRPDKPVAAAPAKVWVFAAKPDGEDVAFEGSEVALPRGEDERTRAECRWSTTHTKVQGEHGIAQRSVHRRFHPRPGRV